MLISDKQLAEYGRDGYLVLEDFIDGASCDLCERAQ